MHRSSSGKRILLRVATIAAGLLLACHAALLTSVQDDLRIRAAINDGFTTIVCALTASALLWAARHISPASARLGRAWTLLTAAVVFAMAGVAIGFIFAAAVGRAPTPSPADGAYLLFYLLFIAAIVTFGVPQPRRDEAQDLVLDAGVMVIGSLMIYFAILLKPLFESTQHEPFAILLTLMFPFLHLVPVWAAVLLLLRRPLHDGSAPPDASARTEDGKDAPPLPTWSVLLLAFSAASMAVGDAAANTQMLHGVYTAGTLTDLSYSAGLLFIALAGIAQVAQDHPPASQTASPARAAGRAADADPLRRNLRAMLVMPVLWVALAVMALVWSILQSESATSHWLIVVMTAGVIVMFVLVLVRLTAALDQNVDLTHRLRAELEERRRATTALEQAKQDLEARINARTVELSRANADLTREVNDRTQAERELDRQRAFLRQVLDLSPALIYAKDANGRYILANHALAQHLGATVDEVIGKTEADFHFAPDDVARMQNDDRQVMLTRQELVIPEEAAIDASGAERWLQIVKRPLIGADGTNPQVLGVATDITERKNAECALRLSEKRYHILFEEARDAIVIADLETGAIMDVNRQAELLLNQPRHRLVGQHHTVLHPPETRDAYRRVFREQAVSGGVVLAELMTHDGRRIPVEINCSVLDLPDGRRAVSGFFRDVSDRTRAQAELERTHLELARAYQSTLEGWTRALDIRDNETEGHSRRVAEYTALLAHTMGVPDDDLPHIRRGALLHDIGKMGVSDSILRKPGPLTEAEWEVMRLHPVLARDMLWPIDYLRPALDIPYYHHERWDGSGYPRGLKEEDIPLAARLFAIVDVWDALRSDRPYRKAWQSDQVLQYLRDQAGVLFDPSIVEAFMPLTNDIRPAHSLL
jgi:PAS domain S-box-containing protein